VTSELGRSLERDVPVWLVIVIFVWIEATVDAFAWTFLGPSAVKWTATRSASEALIQGIPQNTIEIGLTLALAAWLGWWDGMGLRSPRNPLIGAFFLLPAAGFVAIGAWRVAGEGVGPGLMMAALVYYTIQPAGEEIVFRGLLLHGLRRRLGDFLGVLLSSGLFALAHFVPWGWPPTARSFALLFGFGVLACAMRIGTGSLWYPIAFHGLYNLMWTTYDWIDHPVPEYAALWYWARSIRMVAVVAMVFWLLVIVLHAWFRFVEYRSRRVPDTSHTARSDQPIDTVPRIPKS
jgi:membrane protease YdiL (CAAX protease family)